MKIRLAQIRKLIFWAFLLFVGVLLAFTDTMGMLPIVIVGFKFYGADLILVFLILIILFYGLEAPFKTKIGLALLIMLVYGIFCLVHGYLAGYELRDVIGDFRRLYLYSLSFGITWVILDSPDKLGKLNRIAYLAVVPVVVLSILRAFMGVSWSENYEAEDIRAVSYATAPVLFWVFYDSSSRLLIRAKSSSWIKNLIWVIVVGFTLLISNYRALWLLPVLGLAVLIIVSHLRGMIRIGRIVFASLVLIIAIFISVLVLSSVFPDIFNLIENKFVEDVLGFRWEGSFRYFVWGEAWKQFANNVWLGIGIGHRLQYWLLNSIGQFYLRESTAHNILVDYFYQTGLVGGLFYLVPQLLFFNGFWRGLLNMSHDYARLAIALFSVYFSMFALGLLQPFLTIPSVAVLFYIVMGIISRCVFWGKHSMKETLREDRYI